MIQRIQTVYLLAAFALSLSLFFVPMARFIGGGEEFRITLWGIDAMREGTPVRIVPTVHMGILAVLSALLPLVNIFLFRRRWIQIRLCIVEIVLLVGLQVYICFYVFRSQGAIAQAALHTMTYSLVDLVPVAAIVLNVLAFRGIAKDEALVRSLDRIR